MSEGVQSSRFPVQQIHEFLAGQRPGRTASKGHRGVSATPALQDQRRKYAFRQASAGETPNGLSGVFLQYSFDSLLREIITDSPPERGSVGGLRRSHIHTNTQGERAGRTKTGLRPQRTGASHRLLTAMRDCDGSDAT